MKGSPLTKSGTSTDSVSVRPPRALAPERRQPPRLWPWLLLLVASTGILSAVGWEIWPWAAGAALQAPYPSGPVAAAPVAPGRVRARIFLPDESKQVLVEEERDIPGWLTLRDGVHSLLAQLALVRGGSRSPLPPDTTLRHVFLDAAAILYLDFDQHIQGLAGGDWMRADLASSAIGLTLTGNLGEVKRIQFLTDGNEVTLLSGGMDFRRPFTPRFPGEESAPEPPSPAELR